MTDNSETKSTRGERTRRRIMAYARRQFMARGFRHITVEQLCAGMGMSKRTFYKYFSNRDDLVEALVFEQLAEIGQAISENFLSDQPAHEVLMNHFHILNERFINRISLQLMVDVQDLLPESWAKIEQFRSTIAIAIAELIKRGQEEGTMRRGIDPLVVGKFMQLIFNHIALPNVIVSAGLSFPQVVETIEALFIHGLLAEPKQGGE